jgi:carbon starvation protein CstA
MLTFLVCLTALVIAYFTYGRYLERVAAIDPARSVPSETLFDGVDYVPMPRWRVFLIQLLNIAGTGPIFGAILGAAFGPVAFLWITLGGIFMGAMHDFLSGVMLVRNDGLSIPEAAGRYLGTGMRQFMRLFSVVLLVLVGAVFLLSPADILSGMVPSVPHTVWVWLILAYYFVATLLPIDKIIGKIYPIFGVALTAGRAALRPLPDPRTDDADQRTARPALRADRPDALHHHRVRRHFGLSRHAVAADGPLRA